MFLSFCYMPHAEQMHETCEHSGWSKVGKIIQVINTGETERTTDRREHYFIARTCRLFRLIKNHLHVARLHPTKDRPSVVNEEQSGCGAERSPVVSSGRRPE